MRVYVIDELLREQVQLIEKAMKAKGWTGGVEGIYYLPLPQELLDPDQAEHLAECGPFFLAVEVLPEALRLELLVRAANIIRCSCIRYATPVQRNHMIDFFDAFIRGLDIPV